MADRAILLTYRDYCELPDDGRRYEIHDGELSVTPAPNPTHQRLLGALYKLLDAHIAARAVGEVILSPLDVILSDTTIVQPDLVYLDLTRSSAVSSRGIEGPPTLAIEILSPATARIDRDRKLRLYARHGVPYYWIVDPVAQTLEAFVLGPGGYILAARVAGDATVDLPPFGGLALPLSALWR
jgi:Uma2 family endonuclease